MLLFHWAGGNSPSWRGGYPLWLCIAGACAMLSLAIAVFSVVEAFVGLTQKAKVKKGVSLARLRHRIVLPLVLSGAFTAWFASSYVQGENRSRWLVIGIGVGAAVIAVLPSISSCMRRAWSDRLRKASWCLLNMLVGLGAGCVLGLVFWWVFQGLWNPLLTMVEQAQAAAIALTVGPPLGFLAFAIAAMAQCGLMGKDLDEEDRELWGSLTAWMIRWAVAWAGLCAVALFSVPLLIWLGGVVASLLGAGWLSTSIGGVLAGRSPLTGGGESRRPMELLALGAPYVFVVGLFVILSWAIAACLDNPPSESVAARFVALKQTPEEPPTRVVLRAETGRTPPGMTTRTREFTEQKDVGTIRRWCYWAGMLPASGSASQPADAGSPTEEPAPKGAWARLLRKYAWVLLACLAVPRLVSWRAGVNTFSLQGLYANRLVRCYLGASRLKDWEADDQPHGVRPNSGGPPRHPDPITGFDPDDDLPLEMLRIEAAVADDALPPKALDRPYRGPYLLINTAMNLVQGAELAWQERKAESFLLSPLYCGSQSTGYQPTCRPTDPPTPAGYGGGISLGTAVATSGAAVSPNMGYHSSPAVTALLTVFNVRLGGWFGNPKGTDWDKSDPGSLPLLWDEFLGRTGRDRRYVYLTDGDHFENLGVYELVRRRCRYIVVCDAGCDPDYKFSDLGNLIRKCRTDLGVPIEIDVTPIKPKGKDRRSTWHCAVGRIGYDSMDPGAEPGILVYLKSSLSGDEPADVLNYAVEHSAFPHQSTLDQFFEESQFESYRALGHHVAREVFGGKCFGGKNAGPIHDATQKRITRQVFWDLRVRWFPPPPKDVTSLSAKRYLKQRQDLRDDLDTQWGQAEPVVLDPAILKSHEGWKELATEFVREYPAEKRILDLRPKKDSDATDSGPWPWLIARRPTQQAEPSADKDRPADPWSQGHLPVGLAIVWPPKTPTTDCELVFWVRPPYRDLGIGKASLERLLMRIRERLVKKNLLSALLQVRYPDADLPERAAEKDRWLALFSRHGFKKADASAAEGDLILRIPRDKLPEPEEQPPNAPPGPGAGSVRRTGRADRRGP